MDGNQMAARFIVETSWEGLPLDVRQKAKTCLLDNLGCMIAGSQARISRICREYADTVWPQGDEASIVMQGRCNRPYVRRVGVKGFHRHPQPAGI